jgi:methionyl-tRNA formyltransferase
MKVVFMGTPAFAAVILEKLAKEHGIAAVVTQPDKASGRGQRVQISPVKAFALAQNIPIFQPAKIRSPENLEQLKAWPADVFVVAAYGQILPAALLALPRFGCVNVHASLLPKYRGAAPVQHAIMHGETETGVTIMQMDEGMDTGDILFKSVEPIHPKDTSGELLARLANSGAASLLTTLARIENGAARPEPQDHAAATYAPRLAKDAGEIDWSKSAREIVDRIRALNPSPGAFTYFHQKLIKLWRAEVSSVISSDVNKNAQPGEILETHEQGLFVHTRDNILRIVDMQEKGGKKMPAADYLRGHAMRSGEVLGRIGD